MDYEYLKNKDVEISGEKLTVKKIEAKETNPFTREIMYFINDKKRYTAQDIALAISRLKRAEKADNFEKLGFFQKLLATIGIFVWKHIYHSEKKFGFPFGFRRYGHHNCAFYIEANLGNYAWTVELVYRDKEEYENGVMPFANCPLKKVV